MVDNSYSIAIIFVALFLAKRVEQEERKKRKRKRKKKEGVNNKMTMIKSDFSV